MLQQFAGEKKSVKQVASQAVGETGPVGLGDYVVQPGDSLESIAFERGFFYTTLLNHPANADLKKFRPDHNALLPGDRVTIPDKRPKDVLAVTGRRHRFRRKGVPAQVRIRLYQDGMPRANQTYTLEVEGQTLHGVSTADGLIAHYVPPNAREGRLVIGPDQDVFLLRFGFLNPLSEIIGIQNRLTNLGYDCQPCDGKLNTTTVNAIRAFQKRNGLTITGSIDQALRAALNDPFAR